MPLVEEPENDMTALSSNHGPAGGHKKIMDSRILLFRRYSLMCIHFSILIALIFVATFEVRSAILLGINATSAFLFLIYVPPSAWLTWREGRNGVGYGAKVKKRDVKKRSGEMDNDVEGGAGLGLEEWEGRERRGWTWDCAGLEVTYLAVQCATTLVASVLCALTLSSAQCYGPDDNTSVFILDEFAQLKERDLRHWCEGVVGATVLSFIQFGLDLAWLGWVISVVRAGSGVRSGEEGMELTRRLSVGVGANGNPVSSPISPTSPIYVTSPTSISHDSPHRYQVNHYHARPHVYHLLQTLLTPTPRLLTALAQRRTAAEAESQAARARNQEMGSVGSPQPVQQVNPAGILRAETVRPLPATPRQTGAGSLSGPGGVIEVPPPYIDPGKMPVPVYPGRRD